jgi:cytochrome c oxidase assembly factor 3
MRASPALLRARAPYLLKNTITGFAICSLVIGICMATVNLAKRIRSQIADTYTINAISQDEFEDVIVPDEPIIRSQQPAGTTAAVQQALDARK